MKHVPGTDFVLPAELVLLAMGFVGPREGRRDRAARPRARRARQRADATRAARRACPACSRRATCRAGSRSSCGRSPTADASPRGSTPGCVAPPWPAPSENASQNASQNRAIPSRSRRRGSSPYVSRAPRPANGLARSHSVLGRVLGTVPEGFIRRARSPGPAPSRLRAWGPRRGRALQGQRPLRVALHARDLSHVLVGESLAHRSRRA